MEAVSSLFASGKFPVRFLRCTDAGEGRPRLVFELTKLTNIEETVCLARNMASMAVSSQVFPQGFSLEIVFPT